MLYDETAEAAVLGSVLVQNEVICDLATKLSADDFAVPENSDVYRKMLELFAAKKPIDAVHLNGSLSPLRSMELLEAVPSAAHAETYADIVISFSKRRKLQNAGREILRISEEEKDADQAIAAAESHVLALSSSTSSTKLKFASELLPAIHSEIEKKSRGEIPTGRCLGLKDLDKILSGLDSTDLVVVAARPGIGKTSLAIQLALNALQKDPNTPIAFFSLEMSSDQLIKRALSQMTSLDSTRVKEGRLTEYEWDKLTPAFGKLSTMRLCIDDSGYIPMSKISSTCRRLKMQHGLGMVFIDYCQLLASDQKGVSREQEVAMSSKECKRLAKELEVPVFLLSQLNRSVETRESKRPNLSDLRESGAIEQDADRVIFIYRESMYNSEADPEEAELIVRKNRHGATGSALVRFHAPSMRFYDDD